jgi:hypothetical protein
MRLTDTKNRIKMLTLFTTILLPTAVKFINKTLDLTSVKSTSALVKVAKGAFLGNGFILGVAQVLSELNAVPAGLAPIVENLPTQQAIWLLVITFIVMHKGYILTLIYKVWSWHVKTKQDKILVNSSTFKINQKIEVLDAKNKEILAKIELERSKFELHNIHCGTCNKCKARKLTN